MKITANFTNIPEFKEQMKKLTDEAKVPFNKELAYLVKQQSDVRDLVPRLSGNLQETASPQSPTSAEYDNGGTYIHYPPIYAARLWFGVDFQFTITENKNARAKWLEPIFNDKVWVENAAKQLFKKYIVDKGSDGYGKFIESNN